MESPVTRGAPASLAGLKVPRRAARLAERVTCPECHDQVATRDGAIAGHYAVGTTMCSASSKPAPANLKAGPS